MLCLRVITKVYCMEALYGGGEVREGVRMEGVNGCCNGAVEHCVNKTRYILTLAYP